MTFNIAFRAEGDDLRGFAVGELGSEGAAGAD
jgi:hypothetical protein